MIVTQFGFSTALGTLAALVDENFAAGWTPYPTTLSSFTAPFIDTETGLPKEADFAGIQFDMEEDCRMPYFTVLGETESSLGPAMLIASSSSVSSGNKVLSGDILMGVYTLEQMNSGVPLETAALTTNIVRRYYRLLFRVIDTVAASPACTWNPSDKSASIVLSSANKVATNPSGNNGARGSVSHSTGKWYLEYPVYTNIGAGSGIIGFSTGSYDYANTSPGNAAGAFPSGWITAPGSLYSNPLGSPDGHHISFAIDLDANKLWMRYDGGTWYGSAAGDPVAGTNGADLSSAFNTDIFPMTRFQGTGAHATINAGDTAFTYTPPTGYEGWSVPTAQAMDGTEIFEFFPILSEPEVHYNSDYDSIYGKGDRVANGLITVSEFNVGTVFGTTAQAFDNNYSNAAGNGPTYSMGSPAPAGAGMSFDFGTDGVFLSGVSWRGETPLLGGVWQVQGGISYGYAWITMATAINFSTPTSDGHEYYHNADFPESPLFIPWPYYEINLPNSQTISSGRFANELWLKVFHSALDGGDRRSGSKLVNITTDLTLDGSSGPLNTLMSGEVPSENRDSFFAPVDDVRFVLENTAGKYIRFQFPRAVAMTKMVLVNDGSNLEVYSGGNPTKYGKWQWQWSNNGTTWTDIGAPWGFTAASQFMVAPTPQSPGTPQTATYWRMVLVTGPAFDVTYLVYQFIFNLYDPGGLGSLRTVDFADGDDDKMSATLTLSDPEDLDPFTLKFSDNVVDALSATLTVVLNHILVGTFDDDGSELLAYSADLEPSSVVQSHHFMTGR